MVKTVYDYISIIKQEIINLKTKSFSSVQHLGKIKTAFGIESVEL
jgi:hypothetical protein